MRAIVVIWLFFATPLFSIELALFAEGVLYNSRTIEYHTWKWAFYHSGHDLSQEEWRSWIGMDQEELSAHFYENYGCAWDPSVFDLQKRALGLIVAKGIALRDGVMELIEVCRHHNIPLVLVTEVPMDQTLMGLEKAGLDQVFERIIDVKELRGEDRYLCLTDSGRVAQKLVSSGMRVVGVPCKWTKEDDFSCCEYVIDD